MTDQMELFAIEYVHLGCRNATQAAKNVGYSEKTAYSQASDLLKKPEVRAKIEELKSQLNQENRDRFAIEASGAIDFLAGKMNDAKANDSDRIRCAVELLNRAGYVAENKISIDTPTQFVITRKPRHVDNTDTV